MLGPLLFLLYVNDIANSSKHLSFYLFADDTSIIYANKNLHNLEQIVNSELSNVSDLLSANKLTLNFKKFNYVFFRPRQKCLTYNPSIKTYDPAIDALSILERKDFVKHLGVLIDYELSWKNHINLISKVGWVSSSGILSLNLCVSSPASIRLSYTPVEAIVKF